MDTIPLTEISLDDAIRFRSWVLRKSPDECWPWVGGTIADCYGKFRLGDRTVLANRVAYRLHYGVDPGDSLVLHSCDNPPCCNPGHLRLGDNSDNRRDQFKAGRTPQGSATGRNILNEELVAEIKERHRSGEGPRSLSRAFGVTYGAIQGILLGKRWRHVP